MSLDKNDMKAQVPTKWGDERRHWHLDKTISITHLISTISLIIAGFLWAAQVDRRIEQNALANQYLKEEITRQQRLIDAQRNEIKGDLRAISNKLDRLIERQIKD